MPMSNRGLSKLLEECGEVSQVAAKLLAYPSGVHPDGKGDLYLRLQEELGDLQAAILFVERRLQLDAEAVRRRSAEKLEKFWRWEADPAS